MKGKPTPDRSRLLNGKGVCVAVVGGGGGGGGGGGEGNGVVLAFRFSPNPPKVKLNRRSLASSFSLAISFEKRTKQTFSLLFLFELF